MWPGCLSHKFGVSKRQMSRVVSELPGASSFSSIVQSVNEQASQKHKQRELAFMSLQEAATKNILLAACGTSSSQPTAEPGGETGAALLQLSQPGGGPSAAAVADLQMPLAAGLTPVSRARLPLMPTSGGRSAAASGSAAGGGGAVRRA